MRESKWASGLVTGQRQANLLFDKGSAIGAGNRLAAREEGEITALATILYQVLLQDVQTDIAVFFLKAAHQPRDEGGSGIHGEGDIHDAVFPGHRRSPGGWPPAP